MKHVQLCKSFCLALWVGGVISCTHVPQPEAEPRLEVAKLSNGAIEVEAEACTAYVEVAANRTWTARAVDPQASDAWAVLDLDGFRNLGGQTEKAVLPILVARNPDVYNGRSASFELISKEGSVHFDLNQKALVAHLSISQDFDPAAISDQAGEYKVKVLCNTTWTASIDPEARAQVQLDKDQGEGEGEITLTFETNPDALHTKSAVLRVSAPTCEDCTLTLTQNKSVPHVEIIPREDLPWRVASVGTSQDWFPLTIESNAEWTVSVKEGSTTVPTFSKERGTGNETVYLTFPNNPSYEEEKQATVVVTALGEGGNSREVVFTQDNALTITLNFLNADNTKSVNAFVSPIPSQAGTMTLYDGNGNAYKVKASNKAELTSKDGFQFGKKAGDYIQLPAIPGRRLSYVFIYYSKTQYRSLMSADGKKTIIKFNSYKLPAPNNYYMEVYLNESQTTAGTAYRIQTQSGKDENVGFKKLVLRYE